MHMNQSSAVRVALRRRDPALQNSGGLMVIGGPPFQGKSVLAAHLAEILPHAYKLEVVDNLSLTSEHWYPEGLTGERLHTPLRSMLDTALGIWNRRLPGAPPLIIVSARAGTRASRRLAHQTAMAAGMKFLYVEAFSHGIRALERLSSLVLSKHELLLRMRRYDAAKQQYIPVGPEEMKILPAVRLRRALSDPDGAIRTVLARWAVA
ncbi:MAG: hypothetical protein ABI818_15550 [Acidobacteriota bacterium]